MKRRMPQVHSLWLQCRKAYSGTFPSRIRSDAFFTVGTSKHRCSLSTRASDAATIMNGKRLTPREAAHVKDNANHVNGDDAAKMLVIWGNENSANSDSKSNAERGENPVILQLKKLHKLGVEVAVAYAYVRRGLETLVYNGERKKIQQIIQKIAWQGGLHEDTLMQDIILRAILPKTNAPGERVTLQRQYTSNQQQGNATGYQPFRPLPLPLEAQQILLWLYEMAFWEGNQVLWTAWWRKLIDGFVSMCELRRARGAFEWFSRLSKPYPTKEFRRDYAEMIQSWGAVGQNFVLSLPDIRHFLPPDSSTMSLRTDTLPGTQAFVRWQLITALVPRYCYYEMARLKLAPILPEEVETSLQDTTIDIGACLNLKSFASLLNLPARHVWSYSRKRRFKACDTTLLSTDAKEELSSAPQEASTKHVYEILHRFNSIHFGYCEHLRWVWLRAIHHPDINSADASHKRELDDLLSGQVLEHASGQFHRHVFYEHGCKRNLIAAMCHSDDGNLVERASYLTKKWLKMITKHEMVGVQLKPMSKNAVIVTHVLSECAVTRKFSAGVSLLYEISTLLEEYSQNESRILDYIRARITDWTKRFVFLASLRLTRDAVDMIDDGKSTYPITFWRF